MNNIKTIFLCLAILMFLVGGVSFAAGTYFVSAHGTQNGAITGVKRLSAYTDGHCAHCHEQHASIDGSEPSPTGGPDNYLLFNKSHKDQTANFCFDCHVDTGSQQSGGVQATVGDGYIYNYSYTYRAGNYNDGIYDIKKAFDLTSSHNLDNIVTFISGRWGYTANSNPCSACHNPHAAQGDPAGSSSDKSSLTRGYPVSRPSLHANLTLWGLWGDASGEKMSDYSSYYQAPYRFNKTTEYEPDGSATTDGTNLTDYVTFCLDCHSLALTSTTLGRSTKIINWDTSGDYHGKKDGGGGKEDPYAAANRNYVLACTDCHEPHGSPNYRYLIRKEVNGGTTDFSGDTRAAWDSLCIQCHTSKLVSYCSVDNGSALCSVCHYHGHESNF